MYLIGIDLGTTNWKVVVYDPQGKAKARFSCPAATHSENRGKAYYDPNELWKIVCKGIKSVLTEIRDPTAIACIATSSAGEALVAINRKGEAIGKVFPWFDTRTMELGDWWDEYFQKNEIYKITGAPPQHKFSLNHLLWIRKNQPSIFTRAKKWLSLADYVAYKLSGVAVMNYSVAATTMMFDVKNGQWSDKILSAVHIDPEVFPSLFPSGEPLGRVRQQVRREIGLSLKTRVVVGGHDHISGALACGVVKEGQVMDSTGTAQVVITPLDHLRLDLMPSKNAFEQRPHVIRDTYYMVGSGQSGGLVLDWIIRELLPEKCDNSMGRHNRLVSVASKVEPGCRGMFFLPHLRGCTAPHLHERSRAGFIGIRAYHKKEDFVRASLEGLAHEFRVMLDTMQSLLGTQMNKVVAIGGSTKNRLLMQLKADISRRQIEIPQTEEAVALGAALLGGIGVGIFKNEEEAIRCVYRVKYRINPDQQTSQFYDELYARIYTRLYYSLRDINEEIGSIFGD